MPELRWERNALGHLLDLSGPSRQRLVRQVGVLRQFPEMGTTALAPHETKRRLIVGPYSIVYEFDPDADVVSVVAIARGGPPLR